jgi:hypothetical protein
MKNTIKIVFAALIMLQCSCNLLSRRMEIVDTTRSQQLTFVSYYKNPSRYDITVHYELDGDAAILSGSQEVLHLSKGNSTPTSGGDWYSDTLRLEYIPKNVTKGKVTIYYEF